MEMTEIFACVFGRDARVQFCLEGQGMLRTEKRNLGLSEEWVGEFQAEEPICKVTEA